MNPGEETWRVELDASRTHQNLVVDQNGEGIIIAQGCGGSDQDDARAALCSAAPDMARVLLGIVHDVQNRDVGDWDMWFDGLVRRAEEALRKAGV